MKDYMSLLFALPYPIVAQLVEGAEFISLPLSA